MIDTVITSEGGRSLRAYRVLFVFITASLCLPLWITEYVPLSDYPNHLARAYILYHYNDVEVYKSMYDRVVEPLPNLAFDIIVPPLLVLFNIKVAGKIFLTLTVLLFTFGCHLLGRSIHGRPTWFALPCAFFIYNSMLFWGFVNYLFGFGMFLVTLSLWLQYHKTWNLRRVVIVSLFAFASYFAHLSSYMFLAMAVLIATIFDCIAARRVSKNLILGLLPLSLPLITFVAYMQRGAETKEIHHKFILQSYVKVKLLNSLSLIRSYNPLYEGIVALAILITLLLLVSYGKSWRVKWAILLAGCGFGMLFLIVPDGIFQTSFVDIRFIPPAAILMLMAFRFEVPKGVGRCALCLFLAASLIRLGGILHDWRKMDNKIRTQVELFNHFENGARVYPVVFRTKLRNRGELTAEQAYWQIIHYSTIYRHTSSPTFFSIKGQQPILFNKSAKALVWAELFDMPSDKMFLTPLGHSIDAPPTEVNWEPLLDNYDYFWCYRINDTYIQYLKDRCELVVESEDGMIFRVNKVKQS